MRGAGSGMALAGFITVRNPRRGEFTAGDAACHPGNGFGEEPRMARMFADNAGDRTVLNWFGALIGSRGRGSAKT